MKKIAIIYIICNLFLLTSACTTIAPSPTPTPTATETATATLIPTETFTPTATPNPEIAPTFAPIPVNFVTNGSREKTYVALTFDLCQLPENPSGFEPTIVETLQRYNVAATFFMGGDWIRTHPQEALLLASNPRFELGNHSWSHPDFTKLSRAQMDEEIVKTQDMLYKLTGRESHLFRMPYGFYNDDALNAVAAHGLTTIQWDTVTGDPDPNFQAEDIQRAVREDAQNGSIVIMHANGFGWHTVDALPGVLDYLQSQGFTLVTVSQLIGLEPMP